MANSISNVKFANDYTAEQEDIERQRKLAEAMQQQGMAGGRPTEQIGGWAIPQSPMEGLGRASQALLGQYKQNQLTERQKALAEAMRTRNTDEAQQFTAALQGTPAQPEVPMPADEVGGGPGRPEMAAVPGDRNKAMAIAMQSQSPMLQSAGGSMLAEMLKRPTTKTVDMGDKIGIIDDRGQLVGSYPKGNTPDAVLKNTTTREKSEIAPSGVVYNPYQAQPGQVFNDPNKTMNIDEFGRPVVNNQFVNAQKDIRAAGRPNISSTVINAGPKAFETELGKLDAEQLGKWRDNAQSAQQTLGIVENLRGAVQQGVFSGGAAQAKTAAANMINGITGATPKNLAGSQLFNAEASKLVLEKVKTLGANPSNADREFIEKTVPQLATSPEARDALIGFMEQKAKQSLDLYQRADTHARANRGLGGFNPLVPMPPSTSQKRRNTDTPSPLQAQADAIIAAPNGNR